MKKRSTSIAVLIVLMLFLSGCAQQSSSIVENAESPDFIITSKDESDQKKLSDILDTVRKEAVVSKLVVPSASDLSVPEGGKETKSKVDYAEEGYEYEKRTGWDSHGNTVYEILADKKGNEYVFRTVEYVYDGNEIVYENRKDFVVPGVNDTNIEYISTTSLDKKGRILDCKTTWAESKGEEPLVVNFARYSSCSYVEFSDTDYYTESKTVEGRKGCKLFVESYNEYTTSFGKWGELPAYAKIEKYSNGRPKACEVIGDDWVETYKFSKDGKLVKK